MSSKKQKSLRKFAQAMGIPVRMAKRAYNNLDHNKKAEIKPLQVYKKIADESRKKGESQNKQ